jgi:hypothetical protein
VHLDVAASSFPIWMLIKFDAGMPSLPLGTFGGGFGWGKNIFRVYSNNKNLSFPFCSHLEAGWGGCEWVHLDDLVLFGKTLLGTKPKEGLLMYFTLPLVFRQSPTDFDQTQPIPTDSAGQSVG